MAAWFGAAFHGGAKVQNTKLSHRGIAKVFIVIVLVLNAIPMFISSLFLVDRQCVFDLSEFGLVRGDHAF